MKQPQAYPLVHYAWIVVMLLWPVAILNYLDRQMLAAMKSSMMADIPDIATKANWGLVLGSFKWVYALLSPFSGYLADRYSRRHMIAASLLIWSVATWATGHVTSFHELITARAIMGISEACYVPTALALIADFHRGATRSRAVGIHQSALHLGLILGGFSGYIADNAALGWRSAFNACGIIGIVYTIPLFALLRNPPMTSDEFHRPSMIQAIRELLRTKYFVMLVLYFTLPAIAGWVVKDWMPDILKDKFNLSQGEAGVSAALYVQVATIVGVLLGGWLADVWSRRTIRGRIYVSAIGMALLLPALFGIASSGTLDFAIVFLALFGLGWGFFDSNNMPILSQLVRPHLRATGYGIMNLASTSFGGFADWGFGALRDAHVSLSIIFGLFSGVALISVVIVLLIRPQQDNAM